MCHQKVQCFIAEELLTDLGLSDVGFQGGVRELSWCGGDGVGDHERCDCPGSGLEYIYCLLFIGSKN